jgi:small neutral amino acid transporter SnatA (MarC family)
MHYLNISLGAFFYGDCIILLLVTLDMPANKRQARRTHENKPITTDDDLAIFHLATLLMARTAAIT